MTEGGEQENQRAYTELPKSANVTYDRGRRTRKPKGLNRIAKIC